MKSRINYVIATWSGLNNRTHTEPAPEEVLKCHIEKVMSLKHDLDKITIMKPTGRGELAYPDYYDIDNLVDGKFDTNKLEIIEVPNIGYSNTQWLRCYLHDIAHRDKYDGYIFIEDDYVPMHDNFDTTLETLYKTTFKDDIGVLCSLKQYNPVDHYEGVQFVSAKTLESVFAFHGGESLLDQFEPSRNGGQLQLDYSELYNDAEIPIEGYLGKENPKDGTTLNFIYWQDLQHRPERGALRAYDTNERHNEPKIEQLETSLFSCIQLAKEEFYTVFADYVGHRIR